MGRISVPSRRSSVANGSHFRVESFRPISASPRTRHELNPNLARTPARRVRGSGLAASI